MRFDSWGFLKPSSPIKPVITTRILHNLCGGVPRLLYLASKPVDATNHLLLMETWAHVLTLCADSAAMFMHGEMPSDGEGHFLLWALGALASGTKMRVRLGDCVPLARGDVQWGDSLLFAHTNPSQPAGTSSVLSYLFVVAKAPVVLKLPPILMLAPSVRAAFESLRDGRTNSDYSIPSALLHSWPRDLDAAYLHVAASSAAELSTLTFANAGALQLSQRYERLVANGMVARWYLLWLMAGGGSSRISLGDVLGSKNGLLDGITVDFSGGLVADANQKRPLHPTAIDFGEKGAARGCVLQMCGGEGAHHALRFAATRADGSHMVVSCQLQSGGHKSAAQLLPLCYLKTEPEQRADPLKDEDAAGDDKAPP